MVQGQYLAVACNLVLDWWNLSLIHVFLSHLVAEKNAKNNDHMRPLAFSNPILVIFLMDLLDAFAHNYVKNHEYHELCLSAYITMGTYLTMHLFIIPKPCHWVPMLYNTVKRCTRHGCFGGGGVRGEGWGVTSCTFYKQLCQTLPIFYHIVYNYGCTYHSESIYGVKQIPHGV